MENRGYEVQRSIRFELEPVHIQRPVWSFTEAQNMDKTERIAKVGALLEDVVVGYRDCLQSLVDFFYYVDEQSSASQSPSGTYSPLLNNPKLASLMRSADPECADSSSAEDPLKGRKGGTFARFKSKWIKTALGEVWRNYKSLWLDKQPKVFDFDSEVIGEDLKNFFRETIKKNYGLLSEMDAICGNSDNLLPRISDIASTANLIFSRSYLGTIYGLFLDDWIKHKEKNPDTIGKKLEELRKLAGELAAMSRPYSSMGLPIEHSSLNVWSVNKVSPTFRKWDEKVKSVSEPYGKLDLNDSFLNGLAKGWDSSCENLHDEMKQYKALQKSAFLQCLQKKVPYEKYRQPFVYVGSDEIRHENFKITLFDSSSEVYGKLLDLTKEIDKATAEKKRLLRQKRGKFFSCDPEGLALKTFPKFYRFCEGYKKVSMDYGNRRTKQFSLRQAAALAERERGYSFLTVGENGDRYLNTFPSSRKSKVYEILLHGKNERAMGDIAALILESITLRALDKICFKRDSEIVNNLDKRYTETIKVGSARGEIEKTVIMKREVLESSNEIIPMYLDVLRKLEGKHVRFRSQHSLDFLMAAKDIGEFEILLKREAYFFETRWLSRDEMQNLLKNQEGNSYKITSWDLERKPEKPEAYTEWWNEIWNPENASSAYPMRLNPEMTISFIAKEWEEDVVGRPINRRYRNRYVLTMTVSHRADQPYVNKAFLEEKTRAAALGKFNERYNAVNRYEYVYWIDKGNKELLTLGVYRIRENGLNALPLKHPDLKIYRISPEGFKRCDLVETRRDGSEKIHFLHKNPSIYLRKYENDESTFVPVDAVSTLGDLTYSKVIWGSIILNGDVSTVFNLYLTAAKRELYLRLLRKTGELDGKIQYDPEKRQFSYRDAGKPIMYFPEEFEFVSNPEEVCAKLSEYLEKVRAFASSSRGEKIEVEDVSIERIGHLRSAICGNVVGVIAKLQECFPGYVVMEALNSKLTNSHFLQNHAYLANMINEKLYSRFQIKNEVPPILKKFRSDIGGKEPIQHGKVIYVNQDGTSNQCPVCGWKLFGHLVSEDWERSMRHWSPQENACVPEDKIKDFWKSKSINWCEYRMDTNPGEFDYIKTGDELATYNIAKKAIGYLQKPKS